MKLFTISTRWIAAIALILLLLVVAACGGGEPTPVPQEAVGTVAPPPTQAPAEKPLPTKAPTEKPPAPNPIPPPTPSEEPLPTLEPDAFTHWWDALQEDITTFQARTTMRDSEGMEFVVEMERVKEPPASHVTMHGVDEDGEVNELETIQIGDTLYMRSKDGDEWDEWMSMLSTAGISPGDIFVTPWLGLQGWEAHDMKVVDRREKVSGIDTIHYQVSDSAIARFIRMGAGAEEQEPGESTFTTAQADFWVAREGEYLVKSSIRFEGTQDGQPFSGEITTEVLAVNQPLTIEPPAGVEKPGLSEDIPVFPGAEVTMSTAEMTMLSVSAPVKEVADFYKEQMPARGWTAEEGAMELENMVVLAFAKDGRSCQVMIMGEGEKTTVNITCGEE